MMDGRVVGAIQVMFTQDGPGDNRWPALDGRGGPLWKVVACLFSPMTPVVLGALQVNQVKVVQILSRWMRCFQEVTRRQQVAFFGWAWWPTALVGLPPSKVVACLFSPVIVGERAPLSNPFTPPTQGMIAHWCVELLSTRKLSPASVEFLMSSEPGAVETCGNWISKDRPLNCHIES